ncbi:thiopurine S-methyltransferase family protein [Xylona heveae TC161]|uniref:Thiopurine S-methyltransferase family protein n=1 Tax=Xylona heveae (strain CBS 132557 / TC161) TaxID=1328760 RepID=A0A165HJJ3_XYLHT|nr:thiopurine S-methyltransferase family protein [Xylona heveae TC161]KZF23609.1 thiopurine S-methyltransferase family protein [Xylona heveae TC161]
MAGDIKNPDGPTPLINHFSKTPTDDHGSAWSALWDSDDSDLWDRGKPSPALIDLIEQQSELLRPIAENGRRKKALVPGCGRGYDVVMLALHGFDAYGLEISETAVATANRYASAELQNPQDYNFGPENSIISQPDGVGRVTFFQGDFFKSDWSDPLTNNGAEKFDLVYDYTFLCALHPCSRPQWANRMGQLTRSDGYLVCLEFPLFKDPALTGPPWGLNGVYWDLLVRGGDGVANITKAAEAGSPEQLPGQFIRSQHTKPPRSYENGKGTDMVGIYIRK